MNKRGIDFASAWANPQIDLSKEMALYVWMGGVGILVGGTGGWTPSRNDEQEEGSGWVSQ